MQEHHKFSTGERVKFIGILRQEYTRPGTITARVNQYTNTKLETHTIGVVNPVTGQRNPFAQPMYEVKWDGKDGLPIMGESDLVLESSIFVHFCTEEDEHIIEATFIDSLPAVKSDIYLQGKQDMQRDAQWWEIVDIIEPAQYRYGLDTGYDSGGIIDIWKVVLRPKIDA